MNRVLFLTLLGLVFASAIASSIQPANEKKVVCYYGSYAVYRQGNGKFDVENIDPFACTHIIYGLVGLSAANEILVLDPYNDLEENWGKGAMKRFTGLKQQNPNLKTMVAIGGWNEGSEKYSQMVREPAKRRAFVQSVAPFLESQNFDGLDFDWEYPANREGSAAEDKQNFVLLLNELRAELEPRGYLLSATVSAVESTIEAAYDIPAISRALNFINVMTHDFQIETNVTRHHSALYGNPLIDFGDTIKQNTHYAIIYWLDHGAPAEKLVVGVATHVRGYLLADPLQNGFYAPIDGTISPGPNGLWGYNELCEKMLAEPGQWTVVHDESYKAPYAYNGKQWIAYDSVESARTKGIYAKMLDLGGVMIWSMETDDFLGLCQSERFPILKAVKQGLTE